MHVMYGKFIFLSVLLLATSALLACQPADSAQAKVDNYLYRLANSLDTPAPEYSNTQLAHLPLYPSRKQRRYELASSSIHLLEFLRLSQCELQRHIGQRNSSLGQVMPATQVLIYEVNFIVLAQQCLTQLTDDNNLKISLLAVLQQKQQQLDKVMWNASFASDEFAQLFSMSSQPLSSSAIKQPALLLNNALKQLLHVHQQLAPYARQHGQPNPTLLRDLGATEDAYRVLAASKRLGELRLSMRLMVESLVKADAIIHQRLGQRPLCLQAQANSQYNIVETVFEKYYIGDIQPYVAVLHQQAGAIFNLLEQLLTLQQPTDDFLLFWTRVYTSDASEWRQFERAIATHTRSWQQLLTQCGQLPT